MKKHLQLYLESMYFVRIKQINIWVKNCLIQRVVAISAYLCSSTNIILIS